MTLRPWISFSISTPNSYVNQKSPSILKQVSVGFSVTTRRILTDNGEMSYSIPKRSHFGAMWVGCLYGSPWSESIS